MNGAKIRKGYVAVAKTLETLVTVTLMVDASSAANKDGGDTLTKQAVLPFLPRKFDLIGVGPGGDYLEVDQLFWCPDEGFTVWISDSDGDEKFERFRADGWRVAR
jgi:hypothetical protein